MAFWRGHATNISRIVPTYALRFAFFGQFRQITSLGHDPSKPLPLSRQMAAGALSGSATMLCTFPLDLLRTRMSAEVTAAGKPRTYGSMFAAARSIVQVCTATPGNAEAILPPLTALLYASRKTCTSTAVEQSDFWPKSSQHAALPSDHPEAKKPNLCSGNAACWSCRVNWVVLGPPLTAPLCILDPGVRRAVPRPWHLDLRNRAVYRHLFRWVRVPQSPVAASPAAARRDGQGASDAHRAVVQAGVWLARRADRLINLLPGGHAQEAAYGAGICRGAQSRRRRRRAGVRSANVQSRRGADLLPGLPHQRAEFWACSCDHLRCE